MWLPMVEVLIARSPRWGVARRGARRPLRRGRPHQGRRRSHRHRRGSAGQQIGGFGSAQGRPGIS